MLLFILGKYIYTRIIFYKKFKKAVDKSFKICYIKIAITTPVATKQEKQKTKKVVDRFKKICYSV